MKLALSVRDRKSIALAAFLGVLVLYVLFTYVISPLMKEVSQLGQAIGTAKTQLQAFERATANDVAIRQQHEQAFARVKTLRQTLPTEEQIPAVIEKLSGLASKTGVKIQTVFPQRPLGEVDATPTSQLTLYKEIPIQIDALAGYHQLGTFLSLVEADDRPLQVSSLRISGNEREPKRHVIKLLLRSFCAVAKES